MCGVGYLKLCEIIISIKVNTIRRKVPHDDVQSVRLEVDKIKHSSESAELMDVLNRKPFGHVNFVGQAFSKRASLADEFLLEEI